MTWVKALLKKRGHKYSAQRTTHAGYSFASKLEALRFAQLELLKRAGEVIKIQRQAQVLLSEAAIIYKPDFKVTYADGRVEYEEIKGFETPEWRIKRRLWLAYGPGALRVYKARGKEIYLHETLEGRNSGRSK